jgi:hypothetical protein
MELMSSENQNENPSRIFETSSARISMLEHNIVLAEDKQDIPIGLQHAVENMKVVNSIHSQKNWGLLVDSRKTKSMDKDARDYYSRLDKKPGCAALAILIESNFSKVIANFFIGFSRPEFPTKLFTSKEEAMEWLKEKIG